MRNIANSCAKQAGDTIIEVLLAMSVVGLVIGGAFGLASRAARTGQAAQERTEALKLAESQLEFTKSYVKNVGSVNSTVGITDFCMNYAVGIPQPLISSDCNNRNFEGTATGLYTIAINENADFYTVEVTWKRIGTGDDDRVVLYYRVGAL